MKPAQATPRGEPPAGAFIYVLRHGETEWNRTGRLQGRCDPQLSFAGARQMAKLRRLSSHLVWERSYSSPLARAQQSLAIMNRHRGVAPVISTDLAEMCFGEFQGRCIADLEREHAGTMARWKRDPWSVSFPGGETLNDVETRVTNFISTLHAHNECNSCIVSAHGITNRVLILHLLGAPRESFWELRQENASLAEIHVEARTLAQIAERGVKHA